MTFTHDTLPGRPTVRVTRARSGLGLSFSALLSLASLSALMMIPLRAAATEPPEACAAVRVVESGALAPAWRSAVASLRAEVRRLRPAECVEITLVVRPEKDGALLTASAIDGRRGERAIGRPASLVSVALGLIASVPAEESATAAASSTAPSPTQATQAGDAPSPAELPPPDPPAPPARTEAKAPPSVHLEAALAAGGRFGFPTRIAMADLEARADAVAGAWLVIATARFAPFGARLSGRAIPGFAYDEVVLGVGFGRRWVAGDAALDVTLSPELAVMTEEGDLPTDGTGGTDAAARLAAAARLHLPFAQRFKPTLSVDAELVPSTRAALRVDAALPPLPTWTLGLRAGAVGELL